MSIPREATVYCAKCGQQVTATVFESLNSDDTEDLAMQITNGTLFEAKCPHCQCVFPLEYDVCYRDLRNGATVLVIHKNAPDYEARIAQVRAGEQRPDQILRIVEDMDALKEKVWCLECHRDDRVIELCKVFTAYKFQSQNPEFVFQNARYRVIDDRENVCLYDQAGNEHRCELTDRDYASMERSYRTSPEAAEFDGHYAVVDYAWAEAILRPFMKTEQAEPPVAAIPEDVAPNSNEAPVEESDTQNETTAAAPVVPVSAPPAKRNGGLVAGLILTSVLMILLACANLYQYRNQQKNTESIRAQLQTAEQTVSAQNDQIAGLESQISAQANTISTQKGQIADLTQKGDFYDEIVSEMRYGNIGYASDNFCVDDSVIVVSKNETGRKFTLTANWTGGGTVSVERSSYAADVSFDNVEWQTSTQLTVLPNSEGVTVMTFSNDVDFKTFKMLIIVTD